MKHKLKQALVGLILMAAAATAAADDTAELTAMLDEFLANSHQRAMHEQFWADDLVYSSSAGLRFGKADILQGFADVDDAPSEPPSIVFSADEVDVRLYDDMAVVAFKLVGTPADGSAMQYYFNTGTFLKRDGAWQVVAWQATRIPAETE